MRGGAVSLPSTSTGRSRGDIKRCCQHVTFSFFFRFPMVSLTDLCLNGQALSLRIGNQCRIFDKDNRWVPIIQKANALILSIQRKHLVLTASPNDCLEFDVKHSVGEFNVSPILIACFQFYWSIVLQYGDWVAGQGAAQVLDFKISLETIPPWMETYSPTNTGCLHRILVTLRTECSRSKYEELIAALKQAISPTLRQHLGKVFLSFNNHR